MIVSRAPGRLDVMGGIADYSGSLVLQLPLDRTTTATLEPKDGDIIDVYSIRGGSERHGQLSLSEVRTLTSSDLAQRYSTRSNEHWLAYVAGVLHAALSRHPERREGPASICRPERSEGPASSAFTLHIKSTVPEGKGISSSAALEVACFGAIARHFGIEMSSEEIAAECQWAENHVAGAPCGIMDQMTSACGVKDHLLRLRCQPATIEGQVAIPEGYRFFGIDSGIRHAVTGSDYGTVRTAAFMGYKIITQHARRDPWNGYLANIDPVEFEEHLERHLPAEMTGAAFLSHYGGIHDTVTSVAPDRTYPVRVATRHPVMENPRVERFADLLARMEADEMAAIDMGALMLESHASYSACGLGSDGTDALVQLAIEAGPARGIFGAKITGGGSGGTVAILARSDALQAVYQIADAYRKRMNLEPEIFAGSGPGLTTLG